MPSILLGCALELAGELLNILAPTRCRGDPVLGSSLALPRALGLAGLPLRVHFSFSPGPSPPCHRQVVWEWEVSLKPYQQTVPSPELPQQ